GSAPSTWSYASRWAKPSSWTASTKARTPPGSAPISVCGNTAPTRMPGMLDGRAAARPQPASGHVRVRAGAARLAAVERVDAGHCVGVELEVEHLEVLADPGGRGRLRDDHVPALDVPAQDDLGRRPVERRR